MRSSEPGPNARTVTNTACTRHLGGMPPATIRGALATDDVAALAAKRLIVLPMQRGLIRPGSVAHNPTKVEPVIVRNFTSALP